MNAIDDAFAGLERGMHAALVRQKAIQVNLANATTPGYQRLDVKFESLMPKGATLADVASTEPLVVRDTAPGRSDGNNVEFDQEYAAMERNRAYYEALVEVASLRFQGLKQAISSR
jgi:flagellar basal-body rod protein FlgB